MYKKEIPKGQDPLVLFSDYWYDVKFRIVHSLLYMYNYALPWPVARYFFHLYRREFVICVVDINPSFISRFKPFKRRVSFYLSTTKVNGALGPKAVLDKIVVRRVKEWEYKSFMENNPQFLHHNYSVYFEEDLEVTEELNEMSDGKIYYRAFADDGLYNLTIVFNKYYKGVEL